ncbi:MAG TPA: hypothetical protein VFV30_08940 [Novosphingobium sp.]|nr:hypothetical protein [Novosphingobium sp.]
MNTDRYLCCDEQRRTLLAAPGVPFTGIDYVEVRTGTSLADPVFIDIYLVKPMPLAAAALTTANFRLTGGTRFPAPTRFKLLTPLPNPVDKYVLEIEPGQPTDFSAYVLRIVAAADSLAPPAFLDGRLAAIDFSFKVGCAGDFDCADPCDPPPDALGPDPEFDYRVRDYQGFRRLMLDRMAALVPGFREDNPVDFTTTLVEALAYRADQLSYKLDWVGTEAFLSTARSRTSLSRLARLVDYTPGEATSARVFVRIDPQDAASDGQVIASATPLLVRREGAGTAIPAGDYARLGDTAGPVFETVAPLRVWRWRNAIALHTWSDETCTLPRGSRAATLVDASAASGGLAKGDFLLLEEIVSPTTGVAADARPANRHVVRLTKVTPVNDVLQPGLKLVLAEWGEADALPFDLVIQARVAGGLGSSSMVTCARAAANLMLADHGRSLPPPAHLGLTPSEAGALEPRLDPPAPGDICDWQPRLDRGGVARTRPFRLTDSDADASARALAAVDPATCLAAFELLDDFGTWQARPDLLKSSRFSREFVLETAIDGHLALRFGDGINGLCPDPDMRISARGRFGSGIEGNIGIGALAHLVVPASQAGLSVTVGNPLPAAGGQAAEPASQVRINAPIAFRRQERAVVAQDYADAAMRHPGVANAVAEPIWTGAWQTMLLYIDRTGGLELDAPFRRDLLRHMERFRLIGFDIALHGAQTVALDLAFLVCAEPNALRSTVAAGIRAALRPGGGDQRGFFHPDNFTFGSPLYLSQVVAAIMAVDGVQSVTPRRFQRLGFAPDDALARGVITPGPLEVLQLADDPSFPERGRLGLEMGGGR